MARYDVALWQKWPPCSFPLIALLDAMDGVEAIEKLMNVHHLDHVAHAAVKLEGDSFVARYQHVMLTEGMLESNAVIEMR